jgi:hypothetical protein
VERQVMETKTTIRRLLQLVGILIFLVVMAWLGPVMVETMEDIATLAGEAMVRLQIQLSWMLPMA